MKKVQFSLKILFGLLALLAGWILWLAVRVLFAVPASAESARDLAVASEILVPMFGSVLTAIVAIAAIKGVSSVANNIVLAGKGQAPEPIQLFDW